MPRWKITIEYDGTDFAGWQVQKDAVSVQEVLEGAIFKLCGKQTRVHVAGRTDSGVHALGQVAHFDVEKDYQDFEIRNALNVHMRPHQAAIILAERVADDFHARFQAVQRHYRYVICNRPAPLIIGRQYAWYVRHSLDTSKMQQAASALIGTHDFSSFRAVRCQAKHAIRTLDRIDITKSGENIFIDLSAPSFLHHQVRNIVGTLKKIGEGSWEVEKMARILQARDRIAGGPTAPPHGLFLVRVDYTSMGINSGSAVQSNTVSTVFPG